VKEEATSECKIAFTARTNKPPSRYSTRPTLANADRVKSG
jgi:hypothetical protein